VAKLKFLQYACAFSMLASVWIGCAGPRAARSVDSPSAAEKVAVELANGKCRQEFGKSPFKTGRFPATRSGDRWLWGWLDPASAQGYTAQVSFHSDRSEAEVDIHYATEAQDELQSPDAPALYGPGEPRSDLGDLGHDRPDAKN
jgi:hypothetical protein